MLNTHSLFLILLYTGSALIAHNDPCIYKGKALSPNQRARLISWQKKQVRAQTPYRLTQQISQLQSNPILQHATKQLRHKDDIAISWDALEKKLSQQKCKTFYLFGFGSLINANNSLNAPCQPNINIPGIVFGVRRIYNMTHPQPEESCIGMPTQGHEDEELRLDTHVTGNIDDYANGILLSFDIGTPQYRHLKDRERKYRLIPIKVVDYRSLWSSSRLYDAYILCGKEIPLEQTKNPHTLYNSIVIEGAQRIEHQGNPGFLSLLLDTTYLPDQATRLRTWIIDK